jgi:hypothetical protein
MSVRGEPVQYAAWVRAERGSDSGWWRLARAIGWIVTVLWALLVLSVAVDSYENDLFVTLFAVGVMMVPCVPFWWWQVRRIRRRRAEPVTAAPVARESVAGVPATREPIERSADGPSDDELEDLPESIREEWRRLRHARDLVHAFAEDGWVEPTALLDVDDHVARLRRLLEADERTDRLGGAASNTLRRQVEELRALLVALADEAVELQASLADDDPAAATLADARERVRTTTEAYRELRRPHEVRDLQQPG